jgi:hypothetical protein
MSNDLRSFLELPYEELEELNLKAKEQRRNRVAIDKIREERLYRAARERFAAGDRLDGILLGARGFLRRRKGAGLR